MKFPFATRSPIAVVAAGLLVATGCAYQPAFMAALPETFDSEGKAIAIIGDLQQTSLLPRLVRRRENNAAPQQQLLTDLANHVDDLAALVIVGDLVYSARSKRDWAHFDRLVEPFVASMPILPAIGNHDYPCFLIEICNESKVSKGMLERFPWFSPGRPYAVSSGDLLLLFLDSESQLYSQGNWLDIRLREARGRYAAALIFFHRPPYTNSIDRGAEGDPDVQRFIVPRLEAAALPVVVFNGHVHGFEYIVRENVHYVTTAGGGGPRGPMAAERPFDRYAGKDCLEPNGEDVLRPFNYLLLRREREQLTIEVRGFCRGDNAAGLLDTIRVPVPSLTD
jgi:Icc-related predicted phosphoesterase